MANSHEAYKAHLLRFASAIPRLLTSHSTTASLVLEFQKLGLEEQFNRKFALAMVGRMRSGKSTLINALIGRRIAPVGVNETTATLNWIDRGNSDMESRFEVHWRTEERDRQELPLQRIGQFLGQSASTGSIDHLQFYADSSFLANIRLIDTPGSQAVLEAHEQTLARYLNRKSGERADAIVVVLGQTVGQADQALLEQFSEQSRLPGQTPYNTIAVLQKWETFDHPAPELEAARVAAQMQKRLEGKVADVLPVSGLMALMAREVPLPLFDALARLAAASPDDVEFLTANERRFKSDRAGLPLNREQRHKLFDEIANALTEGRATEVAGTWPLVRFALGLAHRRQIKQGAELRQQLLDLSNIGRFEALLRQRILTRQEMIRAGSVLAKALEPCKEARYRLSEEYERRRALVPTGESIGRRIADERVNGDTPLLRQISDYVENCQAVITEGVTPVGRTLRELDELIALVESDFLQLASDTECLDLLDDPPVQAVLRSTDLEHVARHLFGQFGMEYHERLGASPGLAAEKFEALAIHLLSRFGELRWHADPKMRKLAGHAEERLNRMLNELAPEVI